MVMRREQQQQQRSIRMLAFFLLASFSCLRSKGRVEHATEAVFGSLLQWYALVN